MKGGRSSVHRPPPGHHSHHPPAADDWGEESWTVDCICGVTFDDGEEMVNCDDCGVWVHTRCSRYVKGEDLFTCDNCKKRQNSVFRDTHVSNFDSSEETEVAQLLVELPTKTVRLENNGGSGSGAGSGVAGRKPFRLWTDIPMEERVHVQGVPGGDPALFTGFGSGVFTPALWKCSGYVPKKFNFRYREFPCWDEEEGAGRGEGGGLNEGDKGAGVLFSLSKANRARERDVDGIRRPREWGPEIRGLKFGAKKERSLLRPAVMQPGKRKKEDAVAGKDRSARKKARAADRVFSLEKRGSSTLRTAFASTSEPPQTAELPGDRGPRSCKSDSQTSKAKNLRDPVITRVGLDSQGTSSEVKDELEQIESALEALSADLTRPDLMDESEQKDLEKATDDNKAAAKLKIADDISAQAQEQCDVLGVNKEGENMPNHTLGYDVDALALAANDVKPVVQYLNTSVSEAKINVVSSPNQMKGSDEKLQSSGQPNVKLEVDVNNCRGSLDVQPSEADVEDGGMLYGKSASRAEISTLGGILSEYHVLQATDRPSERRDNCSKRKGDESSSDPCHTERRQEHLQESMPMKKEQARSRPSIGQHKTTFQDETSSSSLIGAAITKTSCSDTLRSADTANTHNNLNQHAVSESTVKKNSSKSSLAQDVDRTGKEHHRSSIPAAPKASNSSKVGQSFSLWRTMSDSKDSMLSSSSKVSPKPNSSEAADSQQRENYSNVQNKATARGDKCNLSYTQLPLKSNHVPLANTSAPTGSAILSDEELALLLHQQLNSSPRVPRVPRVRQSMPQLASPTAASMLLKRSSSSGGKDHSSFSRRKSKDVSKDARCHSHEPDDGAKRTSNRGPLSPDLKRQDSGNPSTGKEDGGSLAGASSGKNNIPPTSTSTANSGPSSSTEVNDNHLSSIRNLPRDESDEDTGSARGPVHRTLPGLINDIMSKGRRMTYEELCNAVLPHWNNLRKHNGERYAYSSPSQAVLDCLRNRQEWAQLVDRGPKTNANRKKRKVDAEESDDNGNSKGRTSKDEEGKSLGSQREDFPKGKRKARKRKPTLQGRGLKESKKRRKLGSITDDDSGEYSDASEKSQSSEDDIQEEGGAASVESEPSASFEDCET